MRKPSNFTSKAVPVKMPIKVEDTIPPKSFNNDNIDVLCVNCMKMVSISLVAEHSLHCIQVNTEVKLIEQCSPIQQVNFKIRKLNDSITRLNKDKELLAQTPNNPCYLKMLSEYAEDLLNIVDYTSKDIVRCREIIFSLNALNTNFAGSAQLRIYVERLFVLAKEKHVQLLRYYEEIAANNPGVSAVKSTDELLDELKARTEQFRKSKNSAREMRNSNTSIKSPAGATYIDKTNQVLDDIRSDTGHDEYREIV